MPNTASTTETVLVPAVVEKTVTITLSEQDALNLLAICGRVGGLASRSGRSTFTDREDSLSPLLRKALDIGGSCGDNAINGSVSFTRHVTREDFNF